MFARFAIEVNESFIPEEYEVGVTAVADNEGYFLFLLDDVSGRGVPKHQKAHDNKYDKQRIYHKSSFSIFIV